MWSQNQRFFSSFAYPIVYDHAAGTTIVFWSTGPTKGVLSSLIEEQGIEEVFVLEPGCLLLSADRTLATISKVANAWLGQWLGREALHIHFDLPNGEPYSEARVVPLHINGHTAPFLTLCPFTASALERSSSEILPHVSEYDFSSEEPLVLVSPTNPDHLTIVSRFDLSATVVSRRVRTNWKRGVGYLVTSLHWMKPTE